MIQNRAGPVGPLNRVLIANRGEIALRAVHAARALGIKTVAVFSTADAASPHVSAADEAVCIGPPAAQRSYLDAAALLHAAKAKSCDGIYPGYGFLSERAEFARRCEKEGLIFVGPQADIIASMGDKAEAKATAARLGLPLVPGTEETFTNAAVAKPIADGIGYPVLLKARSGGGGRGMRVARDAASFAGLFEEAVHEAEAAFGDGAVYLERFLPEVRHIEVQVFGDAYGTVRHLGERDCTIQRRHQKLIEEGPSPVLTAELRAQICAAGEKLAAAVGYLGAGTVEFVFEPKSQNFYFIEMNTRIQVEHPVTEMLIGHDLIAEQFRIARGERLTVAVPQTGPNGHAIEFRINAEDWRHDFRPAPGRLDVWRPPVSDGVRIDSFVYEGLSIPPFYDSMIGKLIVHGENREQALARAAKALADFRCEGVTTTLDFHRLILADADFRTSRVHTRWVETTLLPRLLAGERKL